MTTDERLAALEAKMDALTAPPSDYYTSRYSGEEIDAAIAAVPGKAETAQLCNRNLLDNWYFGNPVNQRGQTEYNTNWQQYTVDRWATEGEAGDIKVVVSTGRVDITNTRAQSAGYQVQFKQNLPAELCLPGKTFTLSVLTEKVVGGATCYLGQVGSPYHSSFQGVITSGLTTYTGVMIDGQQRVGFTFDPGSMVSLIAVKLELGTQQTLAHQDAGGNWVLNEVPDYGEQLRRCQRYFARLSGDSVWSVVGIAECYGTNIAALVFWLPVPMRTIPSIVAPGLTVNGVAVSSITTDQYNPTCLKYKGTLATNVPAGIYAINQAGSGYVDVSSDL